MTLGWAMFKTVKYNSQGKQKTLRGFRGVENREQ